MNLLEASKALCEVSREYGILSIHLKQVTEGKIDAMVFANEFTMRLKTINEHLLRFKKEIGIRVNETKPADPQH